MKVFDALNYGLLWNVMDMATLILMNIALRCHILLTTQNHWRDMYMQCTTCLGESVSLKGMLLTLVATCRHLKSIRPDFITKAILTSSQLHRINHNQMPEHWRVSHFDTDYINWKYLMTYRHTLGCSRTIFWRARPIPCMFCTSFFLFYISCLCAKHDKARWNKYPAPGRPRGWSIMVYALGRRLLLETRFPGTRQY